MLFRLFFIGAAAKPSVEDPHPKGEFGHLVIVDRRATENGVPGTWVWSSNKTNDDGSSGYGRIFVADSRIRIGVLSKLENPQNLINWVTNPKVRKTNPYLVELTKRPGTLEELKKETGLID